MQIHFDFEKQRMPHYGRVLLLLNPSVFYYDLDGRDTALDTLCHVLDLYHLRPRDRVYRYIKKTLYMHDSGDALPPTPPNEVADEDSNDEEEDDTKPAGSSVRLGADLVPDGLKDGSFSSMLFLGNDPLLHFDFRRYGKTFRKAPGDPHTSKTNTTSLHGFDPNAHWKKNKKTLYGIKKPTANNSNNRSNRNGPVSHQRHSGGGHRGGRSRYYRPVSVPWYMKRSFVVSATAVCAISLLAWSFVSGKRWFHFNGVRPWMRNMARRLRLPRPNRGV
jgi:hypothetical protein